MAHAVDPISHHHPPQERQPTAMPELSYHQPHQPPEQSYAENLAEPTEANSKSVACIVCLVIGRPPPMQNHDYATNFEWVEISLDGWPGWWRGKNKVQTKSSKIS